MLQETPLSTDFPPLLCPSAPARPHSTVCHCLPTLSILSTLQPSPSLVGACISSTDSGLPCRRMAMCRCDV